MSILGSLVVQILGDNSSLLKSIDQSQQVANGFSSNVESGFGKLKEYNTSFNRAFVSGLERGNAGMADFSGMLLKTADNAQLNTGQISELASATGLFTQKQIVAGQATANMALKSVELTRAVADGKMSATEAGAEWRRYAETQQVVGKGSAFTRESMMKLVKTVGITIATLGALVVAGQKVWNMMEEGAVINQTKDSFAELVSQISGGTQIMNDLEKATGGTVSQMALMSRVNQAVTGTQGEVRQSIAESLPALYEMARAAVKLAPEIGTVDFVFDSLIRGVRKGSPLLIDNANIMVKAGGANEAYAASIGKTVEELTDEERTLATLNAVLDQHDNLVEQAGGNLDSQTDSYARMNAALKDLSDVGKGYLATVLEPAVNATYLLLTWDRKLADALEEQNQRLLDNSASYMEYRDGMLAAVSAMGELETSQAEDIAWMKRRGMRLDELEDKYGILTEKMWAALQMEKDLTKATMEGDGAFQGLDRTSLSLDYDLGAMIPTIFEHAGAMRALSQGAVSVSGSFEKVGRQAEGAIQPTSDLFSTLNTNIASPIASFISDLEWFIATGGRIETAFQQIKDGYASGALTEEQAMSAAQDLLTVTEDVTAEMGKQSDWEAVQNLIEAGVAADDAREAIYGSDSVATALEALDGIVFEVRSLTDTYDTAKELHKELLEAAAREYNIQVNIRVNGDVPNVGGGGNGSSGGGNGGGGKVGKGGEPLESEQSVGFGPAPVIVNHNYYNELALKMAKREQKNAEMEAIERVM
jgi:hypothetical protein